MQQHLATQPDICQWRQHRGEESRLCHQHSTYVEIYCTNHVYLTMLQRCGASTVMPHASLGEKVPMGGLGGPGVGVRVEGEVQPHQLT